MMIVQEQQQQDARQRSRRVGGRGVRGGRSAYLSDVAPARGGIRGGRGHAPMTAVCKWEKHD